MRWIVSTAGMMGAVLLAAVILVGCGTPSFRRPLVTDQTPLGMPRHEVLAWHRDHGWCASGTRGEYLVSRLCDNRTIEVRLRFEQGELAEAIVVSYVPAGKREAVGWGDVSRPISTRHEPGVRANRRPQHTPAHRRADKTRDVLEALAVELHTRYGPAIHVSDGRRIWRRPREEIVLMLVDAERAVLERHVVRSPD